MAEAQTVLSEAELQQSTVEIMNQELDRINEERPVEEPQVEQTREEVADAGEPTKTDSNTPTFQEAQEAQQDIRGADDSTEEPTEELQASERIQETEGLEKDDSEVYSNLKPKAQERFKHWIDRANAAEEQYNTLLDGNNQLAGIIQDSTTNPEQLGWALEVFKGLNSGDYSTAIHSLKALDNFSDQIAKTLGVNHSPNDKADFSDFEDLRGAVDNLEMSEDWANRLAQQRVSQNSMHQAQAQFQHQNNQAQQYAQQYENAKEHAYGMIENWEQNLTEKDPDYGLKKDIMIEMGTELAKSNVPPDQWLPVLQNQYNTLSRGMHVAGDTRGGASRSGPLAPSRNAGTIGGATADTLDQAEVTPEFLQAQLDKFHNE